MRILYVNKISPLTGGGAELRLWEVARHLARRGHQVDIVCGKHKADLPDQQQIEGVRLHNVQILPQWLFRWERLSFFLVRYGFYFFSVHAIARQTVRADIVVDCATPVISSAGWICKRLNKPCVVTIYETFGRNWFRLKGPITALLGYVAEHVFYRWNYDGYITLSDQTYSVLVARGKPTGKIQYLRHGAGVERLSRASTEHNSAGEVIFVGRLVKQKNVSSLLRAWAIVHAELIPAQLRIIGDGPDRTHLEELAASLGISHSVCFEGRVSEDRKWEALDRASLFAHPSLQEGFGIVLLEAMLAGLPIVAYDLPIFREFITGGEHGFVVAPDDHEQLAACIIKLLRDHSLLEDIGARNRAYAREFTWEKAADQEEATLLRIVSGAREPAPGGVGERA